MTTIAEGRIIAGKIRLERPLARGGMGSVWVAHHLKLDVPVAVKFMDSSLASSETARTRFEREAKSSAQLRSPHVVQVHDYGVEGETPYIVMELLSGEDLSKRLARVGRLGIAEAIRIAEPITKALRRAHEIGLVHRDLKPGNIFLARGHGDAGEEEIVKLLDFGIAKTIFPGSLAAGDVTRSGNLVGSPLYMSPEQIRRSKEVDHRSDLWSLGVILYEMLTGRPPFVEDEIGAVLVSICTDPIAAPSSIEPSLGPSVDAFFETALAREPSGRFQSAREMFEAFSALAKAGLAEKGPRVATGAQNRVKAPIAFLQTQEHGAPLEQADTLAADHAPGTLTLSPSGRTRGTGATGAERSRYRAAAPIFIGLLGLLGLGGYFFVGTRGRTDERDPGSPTLPLPPPTTQPVAVVAPEKPIAEAPAPIASSAVTTTTAALAEKDEKDEKGEAEKPRIIEKTATVSAKGKAKATVKTEPAAEDPNLSVDDELGLRKPSTTTQPQ